MTGDERDRILGILDAGPATVARLVEGLGLPGGVVSYQLKLLERDGLVRVGTMRTEHGAATAVWVSTAAAAAPPILAPDPLPGLTWVGDDPYPIPVWTAPHPPEPAATVGADAAAVTAPAARPSEESWSPNEPTGLQPTTDSRPPRDQTSGQQTPAQQTPGERVPAGESGPAAARRPATELRPAAQARTREDWLAAYAPERPATTPQPRRPVPADVDTEAPRGPRLVEVRRVPIDDATFYEFAGRLDALAREFAARAVPGAPATELTIALTRPGGDGAGHGS